MKCSQTLLPTGRKTQSAISGVSNNGCHFSVHISVMTKMKVLLLDTGNAGTGGGI